MKLKPFEFAQAHCTPSHSPESKLAQRLWLPSGTKLSLKSAAALWTFPETTTWSFLLTGTSVHKAWGSVNDSRCQGTSCGRRWRNKFQTQPTFRKPIPKAKLSLHSLRKKKRKHKPKPPPPNKMLSIPNCCRNANQKDDGKSNPTTHNGQRHKFATINMGWSLGTKNCPKL